MTQTTRNATITLAATTTLISQAVYRPIKRSQIIITNTDAAATIAVQKGSGAAVLGKGIILPPNAVYIESTDSGFQCWQGEFSAVSSGATTISIVEVIENGQ